MTRNIAKTQVSDGNKIIGISLMLSYKKPAVEIV